MSQQLHQVIQALTIAIALVGISGSASNGAEIDEALRARFLKGISEAQKKVEAASVRAEYMMTDEYPKGDRPSPVVEECKCVLHREFIKEMREKSGVHIELVKNPKYGFRVAKKSECRKILFVLCWRDRQQSTRN